DLLDRDHANLTVADHVRPRGREHREPFQRSFRTHLLHDPDGGIGDQDEAEQGVLEGTDDQDDGEHGAEERVETGEDVRPDDLAVRPRVRGWEAVERTARDPPRNLGCAQSTSRIHHAATVPGTPNDGRRMPMTSGDATSHADPSERNLSSRSV